MGGKRNIRRRINRTSKSGFFKFPLVRDASGFGENKEGNTQGIWFFLQKAYMYVIANDPYLITVNYG